MIEIGTDVVRVEATDGHAWQLQTSIPPRPRATLLWLPAMGVAAKHYRIFADALAAHGIAVFVHEWRGNGASNRRASHACDWGYGELLGRDLPASEAAIAQLIPDVERIVGGHSLGGQLACCRLALVPQSAQRMWLVASGAPYWQAFPVPTRYLLPLAYRFMPWLANRHGALPGRRLGFAGQEARGVMRDWAASAVSGRYTAGWSSTDAAAPARPRSAGTQADLAQRGLPQAMHSVDLERADQGHVEVGRVDVDRAESDHPVFDPINGGHIDLEQALRAVRCDVRAVVLQRDWLAPLSSLQFLLAKLQPASKQIDLLDDAALGTRADHFQWMSQPEQVIARLLADHPRR